MKNKLQFVIPCFTLITLCTSFSAKYNFNQDYCTSMTSISSKKILVIEPAMRRHALPIKNLILTTIKNELDGIAEYEILSLDDVSELVGEKYYIKFDEIIRDNDSFDYILLTDHYFIRMENQTQYGYDVNTESRITMSLFDNQAKLVIRSIKDTSRLPLGTRSDPLKILKRATERAIKEIIEQEILINKN